jgi:DNA-binding MarR family transcriptional regulator
MIGSSRQWQVNLLKVD